MTTSKMSKSKVLRKITLCTSAAIMTVGLATPFHSDAQASGSGNGGGGGGLLWEAKTIPCTITITYGGGPWPYSYAESYAGTKDVCTDGWSLCWGGACKP